MLLVDYNILLPHTLYTDAILNALFMSWLAGWLAGLSVHPGGQHKGATATAAVTALSVIIIPW